MKKDISKYIGWILLLISTIALFIPNYYIIMFARIIGIVGFAIIISRLINTLETRKSLHRKHA